MRRTRPNGGHGGKGGNVWLVTDPTLTSLKMEKHHYTAPDGGRGGSNSRQGRDGKDVYVRVPCGVVVRRVLDWDEMDMLQEEEEGDDDFASDGEEYTFDDSHNLQSSDDTSEDIDDEEESDNLVMNESDNDAEETAIGDNEPILEEEDEFDTYYANLQLAKRQRKRGRRRHHQHLPTDYDEVVNQELRADDGMFHWTSPTDADTIDEDQLASTAFPSLNNSSSDAVRKTVFVADLDQPHTKICVAAGGKAGVGNQAYANRPHFSNMAANAAKKSRPGEGECTYLELELKLIADVGLVGFPNAGKSSLLSAMSKAKPKIASYPFTTLHPLIGTIHYKDGYKVVMADVPGLIDGAAEGRGRGVEFLRHIERTKALVYMVDGVGVDGRNALDDLRVLGKELREYGSSGIFDNNDEDGYGIDDGHYAEETRRRRIEIMNRPSLILANKMDLIPEGDVGMGRREEFLFQLGRVADDVGIVCEKDNILGVSAGVSGEGLSVLSKKLRRVLTEME